MSVRIGLDFRSVLSGPCGISRYARELARGLLQIPERLDLVLYASTRFGAIASDRIPRAIREHPRVDLIERRLPARALQALSLIPGVRLKTFTGPLALLHHTDLTYLPAEGFQEVLTVHDLAYEVSSSFHGPEFRRTVGERVRNAVRRARRIIVPSETTRRDLLRVYGVDEALVRVIPHGCDHVLRRPDDIDETEGRGPRLAVAPNYLLHVGTIEPRKNLVRLLAAYELLRGRGAEADLVLVGQRGWMTEDFDRALERHPYRASIHVLGAVPELMLRDLYRGATALVYPSLYEGFGLPVVEAMALGVPVVTSHRSSTAEVAGSAAELVDPEDVDHIAAGVDHILSDDSLRLQRVEQGRQRVASFNWQRTAQETFDVYRDLLLGAETLAFSRALGNGDGSMRSLTAK